jgi:hypothetical protein
LLFVAKGFTQALDEAGHFEERKGVVDGVAAEGVADAAGDDEGELLGEDGGGGLLAGGAAAKVEAGDEDVCLFALVSGEVMTRKGGDKPPARAMPLKAGSKFSMQTCAIFSLGTSSWYVYLPVTSVSEEKWNWSDKAYQGRCHQC